MRIPDRIPQLVEGLEKALALVLLLGVLLLTFAQVVARFVFSSPFYWTEELARYSYVWLSFVASAFVMADRSHISVEMFDDRTPALLRVLLNSVAHVAVVVTCVVITLGTSGMVFEGHGGTSPALGIPTTLFYGVVYACFAIMGVHAVVNLAVDIRDYFRGHVIEAMGEHRESAL